jgi:hypothetical protein
MGTTKMRGAPSISRGWVADKGFLDATFEFGLYSS